jgi:hypothetical protein
MIGSPLDAQGSPEKEKTSVRAAWPQIGVVTTQEAMVDLKGETVFRVFRVFRSITLF